MPRPYAWDVPVAFAPHLTADEQLKCFAYGLKEPHLAWRMLLAAMGAIPYFIVCKMFTTHFLIGVTSRGRLLVLSVAGGNDPTVMAEVSYDLASMDPNHVITSVGSLNTHIKIADPVFPIAMKCPHSAIQDNWKQAAAIVACLTGRMDCAA